MPSGPRPPTERPEALRVAHVLFFHIISSLFFHARQKCYPKPSQRAKYPSRRDVKILRGLLEDSDGRNGLGVDVGVVGKIAEDETEELGKAEKVERMERRRKRDWLKRVVGDMMIGEFLPRGGKRRKKKEQKQQGTVMVVEEGDILPPLPPENGIEVIAMTIPSIKYQKPTASSIPGPPELPPAAKTPPLSLELAPAVTTASSLSLPSLQSITSLAQRFLSTPIIVHRPFLPEILDSPQSTLKAENKLIHSLSRSDTKRRSRKYRENHERAPVEEEEGQGGEESEERVGARNNRWRWIREEVVEVVFCGVREMRIALARGRGRWGGDTKINSNAQVTKMPVKVEVEEVLDPEMRICHDDAREMLLRVEEAQTSPQLTAVATKIDIATTTTTALKARSASFPRYRQRAENSCIRSWNQSKISGNRITTTIHPIDSPWRIHHHRLRHLNPHQHHHHDECLDSESDEKGSKAEKPIITEIEFVLHLPPAQQRSRTQSPPRQRFHRYRYHRRTLSTPTTIFSQVNSTADSPSCSENDEDNKEEEEKGRGEWGITPLFPRLQPERIKNQAHQLYTTSFNSFDQKRPHIRPKLHNHHLTKRSYWKNYQEITKIRGGEKGREREKERGRTRERFRFPLSTAIPVLMEMTAHATAPPQGFEPEPLSLLPDASPPRIKITPSITVKDSAITLPFLNTTFPSPPTDDLPPPPPLLKPSRPTHLQLRRGSRFNKYVTKDPLLSPALLTPPQETKPSVLGRRVTMKLNDMEASNPYHRVEKDREGGYFLNLGQNKEGSEVELEWRNGQPRKRKMRAVPKPTSKTFDGWRWEWTVDIPRTTEGIGKWGRQVEERKVGKGEMRMGDVDAERRRRSWWQFGRRR